MNKIILIGLIVIALIVGLVIGSVMSGRTQLESKYNKEDFVVDASNKKMVSVYPFNCREEYKRIYGLNGTCEITKVSTQVGNSLIGEFGCSCWCER